MLRSSPGRGGSMDMRRYYLKVSVAFASLALLNATFGIAVNPVCATEARTDESRSAPLAGIQTVGLAVSAEMSDPTLSAKLQEQLKLVAERKLASCPIPITSP